MGKFLVCLLATGAFCWAISRFINLSGTVFAPAGIPISWMMLVALCGFIFMAKTIKLV
jgi:hypothetical protein